MFGLHGVDLAVLLVYLLGITLLGVYTMRLVRTMGDFFMPRRFGKAMLLMHAFGTGSHSDQAVSVASKTYTNGLSGIWYQWLWLFATPFYWLIAPVMRRFRAITVADVFALRYGRSVGMLFAVVGMCNLMVNIGVMLKGSGAIISASCGKTVHENQVILVMTALFLIYGMAGGLGAAIITDFIQGILTIVFSFILLPFVLNAVGGFEGLHRSIKDPQMFSLIAPADIGLFYVVVIALNGLIGIVTQPHTMGNCAAGRTEDDGRFGWTAGNFVKRICTMAWCVTGLAAVAYFADREVRPDDVFGLLARDFLPRIMPGLLGVFLASVLASVMSSCDSFMIASSGLFTENVYRPLLPNRSERHYILVGRITSLFVVGGGVMVAYLLPGVVAGLELFWKIAPMMGIAFWLGLFWRRTTTAGAWASTLTALFTWYLTSRALFPAFLEGLPFSDTLRFTVERGGARVIYLPWQMVFYLSAGTAAGVLVSLFTRAPSEEKLDRFYALVRTPVEPGEAVPETPCSIPEGVKIPEARKLFPGTRLEILVPSRKSIVGFVLSWVFVVFLIWFFKAAVT